MSVRHVGLVLDHLEASPGVKLVAMILADHADADGVCWPSYRRVAQRSCLGERTVRRYVRELIERGIVTKLNTGRGPAKGETAGSWTPNLYRIESVALVALPSLLQVSPDAGADGDRRDAGVEGLDDHQVVGQYDHEPKGGGGSTRPGVGGLDGHLTTNRTVKNLKSSSAGSVDPAHARPPRLAARSEADWQQRAEEILATTAFPSDYQQLAELLAEQNRTRRVALSRVVRELYEPLLEFERESARDAMRAGLRAAIVKSAPNANYVKKAAGSHAARSSAVAVTSRAMDRSDYDDFCTGGEP